MKAIQRAAALLTATLLASGSIAVTAANPTAQAQGNDQNVQIVGGRFSSAPYSWMGENGGCGAALVAPRWIVTAAHCMTPYKIRLNSLNRWEGGENIEYSRLIRHPKYSKEKGAPRGYDIAMVELSSASQGATIPIAATAQPASSMILGWGATTQDGNGSTNLLKELDTSVIPTSRCAGVDDGARGGMELCTDNPGGNQGACFGDSGGPQVQKVNGRWQLIGVTSRGPEQCATAPSIYTSVPFHAKWINEVTNGAVPMPPGWKEIPADSEGPQPTSTPTNTSTPTADPTDAPTSDPLPDAGEIEVTNTNYRDVLAKSSTIPVVVVVGATWSKVTQSALPKYRSRLQAGKDFILARVDGDKYKDALAYFQVKGYPTTIAYSDGSEMSDPARFANGGYSQDQVNGFIDSVVSTWKAGHGNSPKPTSTPKPTVKPTRPPTGGPIKPKP